MAKYGAPINVDVIRGKLGGMVFTKARSGPTMRVRVRPSNPNTTAQSAARSRLTTSARGFKDLSSTDVAAWNTYALGFLLPNGVGGQFIPSGINMYSRLSTTFLAITPAGTPPATPPTSPFVPDAITFAGGGAVGDVTVTASAQNAAGVYVEVLIQPLPSIARQPSPTKYRTQEYHRFLTGALTRTYTKPAGYYSLAVREIQASDGQRGPLTVLGTFQVT